ncbi:polymorphic toxin-type HINT domain-containing protein [Apibacter adventoris]|uniref:MafB-like protein n=1 Tax=Apibacter adventoris TaxID=1679466 RepID=A0A2S8AEE8_9FLAO|nr:polymorphic toxin-type HINT domain-containing protein [Apibacter adventoris]PQL93488.1 MafB-like protein [Apibacter adventoris]
MDDLEYITKGALMMCDKGAAPDYFKPDFNTKTKIDECLVATEMDAKPVKNIPSFKICSLTQKPCVPVTSPKTWKDTWQVKVDGAETLIGKSTCPCSAGGKIEFMTSGQVPLPADAAEEVQKMQDQAQEELNDSGEGDSVGESGLVEGFIPVWGSGRDAVNDFQQGRWGWGLFNSAMVVVDVFTLGGGSVVKGAIKGGVKATAKAVGKSAVKGLAKGLGKGAFKKLTKETLKSSIDDVAKKLLKTCVFACFPAGTQVHTELGLKNIEEIQTGDKVWAYNEETGAIALQEVLYTMEKESDHTIEIITENETIETTALHPFYVNGKWKKASELEKGDKIITQNKEEIVIKSVEFKYTSQKVYNFEVAHWHTYFVGENLFLVHNAKGKCITEAAEDIAKKTDEIPVWKGPTDYSKIDTSKFKIEPGKDFTAAQKESIYKANMEHNGGLLRSDKDGTILERAKKSEKGVTPNPNESQVDHVKPKSKGGTNDPSDNAQILSRQQNRDKSNK